MNKVFSFFIVTVFLTAGILSAQENITFENLPGMSQGRYGMASTCDGKFVYALGGDSFDLNGFLDNAEVYNPTSKSWSIIGKGLLNRRYHNAEYIESDGKIYIFNGECTSTKLKDNQGRNTALRQKLANVEEGDSDIDLISDKNNVLTSLTGLVEVIDLNKGSVSIIKGNPNPVNSAGSAVWNNKIYIFGGWNRHGFSDMLYEYDPAEDEWKRLPDMPEAKNTCGRIIDGILYTFGGFDNGNTLYKSIHAYNIKEGKWTLAGELPTGITANAIASDGRNIWLIGSRYNTGFIASFDTKTKTVTTYKSNMKERMNAGAQVLNNTLYIFGGNQTADDHAALTSAQCVDISKYLEK